MPRMPLSIGKCGWEVDVDWSIFLPSQFMPMYVKLYSYLKTPFHAGWTEGGSHYPFLIDQTVLTSLLELNSREILDSI